MQRQKEQQHISWDQIEEAVKDERVRKKLKRFITPFVESIAEEYLDEADADKQKLVEIGFSHFDKALEKYYKRTKRRRKTEESTYLFSEYFRWWVKRDIEKRLGIRKSFRRWNVLMIKARSLFRHLKTSLLLLFKD